MRVLHLPANIASQINVTVKALCDIGIDARGIVFTKEPIQDTKYIESFPVPANLISLNGLWHWTPFTLAVLKAVKWADVIHWHFDSAIMPFNLDLKYIAALKKGRIVEFWGSDIRIPEIASQDNPHTAQMYKTYPYLAKGMKDRSLRNQKRFAKHGFSCLLPDVEMEPYVVKEYFPAFFRTRQRVLLSEYSPCYPDPTNKCPHVLHAPSKKDKKGTKFIVEIIEKLKTKYHFDFSLQHNIPKTKLTQLMRECDIYLDEFVSGTYGLASIEAMALGKPTMCFIKSSIRSLYPSDLPVISANQDNFIQSFESLLLDGQRRADLGREGRIYVEKNHDAHIIAQDLVKIYEEVLTRNK